MMVNLFTLIKYAAGMEATRNITPGLEPDDDKGWNKLDIDRCVSQPGIYLFFMILGQLGTSLTAWLAFEYEWQYVYYFMMGTVLLSILVIFITMPYHKFATRRFPINFRQFGNVAVFCITLVCWFMARSWIGMMMRPSALPHWLRLYLPVSFSIWRRTAIHITSCWMSLSYVPFVWAFCFICY